MGRRPKSITEDALQTAQTDKKPVTRQRRRNTTKSSIKELEQAREKALALINKYDREILSIKLSNKKDVIMDCMSNEVLVRLNNYSEAEIKRIFTELFSSEFFQSVIDRTIVHSDEV